MIKSILAVIPLIACSCSIDYSYEITGDSDSAVVSYSTESGSVSQELIVVIPWEKKFSGNVGDVVSITVQNQCKTGELEAKIYKKNDLFKSAKTTGQYGIVSVSGTL